MSQPCDQGIIQNLKVHYRRFLLRERIKKDTIINLLGALHNLRRTWAELKPETIANCFRHAKFVINREVEEVVAEEAEGQDDGLDELLDTWADLQQRGGINNEAEMWDFMSVNADVITDGALTIKEIVTEVSAAEEDGSDVGDSEPVEEEDEEPVIPRQEAHLPSILSAVSWRGNTADPTILKLSDGLDEYFYQEKNERAKQSKLTDFFR